MIEQIMIPKFFVISGTSIEEPSERYQYLLLFFPGTKIDEIMHLPAKLDVICCRMTNRYKELAAIYSPQKQTSNM